MSLGFYAFGEPRFVVVMVASILFNYAVAILIDKLRSHNALCKVFLAFCVAGNLCVLFFYKYFDFVANNINRFGLNMPLLELALPLGISFFTFQAMSYVIDVYRQDVKAQYKPHHVGLYISFFPQLIAGPIVRYKNIEDQIAGRAVTFDDFSEGIRRFLQGFLKKLLLANNMAIIADRAFGMPDAERSVIYAWLGAIAYAFQILFDFTGYSDMAIGLGKMFGFKFLENFNYPYISKSITEFWRRWHISLGQWFRDYVYYPLGGSRVKTKSRLVFNLFVVWLLTGIWHGASWNFALWGLMYFVVIVFEKFTGFPDRFRTGFAKGCYRVFTLLCILFGRVLFRADTASAAIRYASSMFGLSKNAFFSDVVILSIREYWVFLVVSILCSTELFKRLRERVDGAEGTGLRAAANTFTVAFYVFCFFWAVSFLILGAHNPFIYFNF
jgi:D-alanyl-lipoteichoic acid acyltransferase DltB (MBOAT superfamily)